MKNTYDKSSEQYKQMLAFLFGITSHIQTDVQWHWGLKGKTADRQGFLQSMSHDGSDCDDDWDSGRQDPNCHKDGDQGSDFYLGGRGLASWLNETWTVPTADLEQIYNSLKFPGETADKI